MRALVSTGISGRNGLAPTNPARGGEALRRLERCAPLVTRPDYVARCPRNPERDPRRPPLMLHLWPKIGGPNLGTRTVSLCGSWRCPSCQRWRASVDFARVKEALGPYAHTDVTFLVLTLDRDGYYSGEAWADARTAYDALSRMARAFMHRINRMLRLDPVGSRWIATVEAHRSGWPHLNLVCVSSELAALVRTHATDAGPDATAHQRRLLRGALQYHATGSGWGQHSSAEVARDAGAIAGYVVKLAGELDAAWGGLHDACAGEAAKTTQRPLQAPAGLRRLRSGRGFLPPRRRNPLWTGALLLRSDAPGVAGASVRPYGRTAQPAPWDSALTRLKYLRRTDDLVAVCERESRASVLPLPRTPVLQGLTPRVRTCRMQQ